MRVVIVLAGVLSASALVWLWSMGQKPLPPLAEVRWERSGDKQGSFRELVLQETADGPRLSVRTRSWHSEPYTVALYRADEGALESVRKLVEENGVRSWVDRPQDPNQFVLDGNTDTLILCFLEKRGSREYKTWERISYESRLPRGAPEVLDRITGVMEQWAVPERLLETWHETKTGVRCDAPEAEPSRARTCPACGAAFAAGDYCPECGMPLDPGAAGAAPTQANLLFWSD